MKVEEIIEKLERLAGSHGIQSIGHEERVVLREAIALLRTHPDAQPNEPLTVEELREVDETPVWVHRLEDNTGFWVIARTRDGKLFTHYGGWFLLQMYEKTWMAYRRPPKEAAT